MRNGLTQNVNYTNWYKLSFETQSSGPSPAIKRRSTLLTSTTLI